MWCYEARHERVHATRGFGVRAAGRTGGRGERRIFRAEGKFAEAREAGFYRGEIHGPGKVDGRVGDAAAADSGMRLVHRAIGAAWNSAGRGGGHELLHGKLSGAVFFGRVRSGWVRALPRRKEKAGGSRNALGRDLAGDCAEGRLCESSGGDTCGAFYARAFQDLSGWRRGAFAAVRRGGAERAANREARTGFGGGGERRASDCDERSILQRATEYVDAGTQQDYERRLGNTAAARAGT